MSRRRDKKGDDGGQGTFLLLFTTLSLILLAFFIFMKTLSSFDDERSRQAISSIRRTFQWVRLGGIHPDDIDEEVSSLTISDQERRFRQLERDLVEIVKQRNLGHSSDVMVEMNDREVRIVMADQVLFRPGLAIVNPRSFPVLDRIGQFLRDLDRNTVVEGHCDPSGDDANWPLSTLRAAAVARYLDESSEFDEEKIRSRGRAHYHRPRNEDMNARRVEIVVPNRDGAS